MRRRFRLLLRCARVVRARARLHHHRFVLGTLRSRRGTVGRAASHAAILERRRNATSSGSSLPAVRGTAQGPRGSPDLDLPAPREDSSERRAVTTRFAPKNHVSVLLDLAIKAKQPDEILHWFDILSTITVGPIRWFNHATIDRVAAAVASTYPERSLQLWNRLIDFEVAETSPAHYEIAAGYLRKVRNLLTSLDRTPEWNARLTSLRETQRRKRRLIEILDGLTGRPIVQK